MNDPLTILLLIAGVVLLTLVVVIGHCTIQLRGLDKLIKYNDVVKLSLRKAAHLTALNQEDLAEAHVLKLDPNKNHLLKAKMRNMQHRSAQVDAIIKLIKESYPITEKGMERPFLFAFKNLDKIDNYTHLTMHCRY